MRMTGEMIEKLEDQIEEALDLVIGKSKKSLPLFPSRETLHLMAKAAVTVYEAAIANQQPGVKP